MEMYAKRQTRKENNKTRAQSAANQLGVVVVREVWQAQRTHAARTSQDCDNISRRRVPCDVPCALWKHFSNFLSSI